MFHNHKKKLDIESRPHQEKSRGKQYRLVTESERSEEPDADGDEEGQDESSDRVYTCDHYGGEFDAPVTANPQYHDCSGIEDDPEDTVSPTGTDESELSRLRKKLHNEESTIHELQDGVSDGVNGTYVCCDCGAAWPEGVKRGRPGGQRESTKGYQPDQEESTNSFSRSTRGVPGGSIIHRSYLTSDIACLKLLNQRSSSN